MAVNAIVRGNQMCREQRRLERFKRWYEAFYERQCLRWDWIPLGDIVERLVQTEGLSEQDGAEKVLEAIQSSPYWFNRQPGRSAAWFIYPETGLIQRITDGPPGERWLDLVEHDGQLNTGIFAGCWVPRDLLIRWCDNCNVSARPVWRDTPTLEFEDLSQRDVVRLRLLRLDRIAPSPTRPTPQTSTKTKQRKRGRRPTHKWPELREKAFTLMKERGGPPEPGGPPDWSRLADLENALSDHCANEGWEEIPGHAALYEKANEWIEEYKQSAGK